MTRDKDFFRCPLQKSPGIIIFDHSGEKTIKIIINCFGHSYDSLDGNRYHIKNDSIFHEYLCRICGGQHVRDKNFYCEFRKKMY